MFNMDGSEDGCDYFEFLLFGPDFVGFRSRSLERGIISIRCAAYEIVYDFTKVEDN